jgi:hypothetical protein
MAMGMNRSHVYCVKFMGAVGVEIAEYIAGGTSDAQDKFAQEHPGRQVITVWRKS